MVKVGDVLNDDTPCLMSIVNHAAKQSYYVLINSTYCKSHVILPAQKHGFIEGLLQFFFPSSSRSLPWSFSLYYPSWPGGDEDIVYLSLEKSIGASSSILLPPPFENNTLGLGTVVS